MTQLNFSAPWPLAYVFAISFVLALVTFVLYLHETRLRQDLLKWLLPLLRSLGILLIAMMISGPRLNHKKIVGQLGRIILCIDDSQSMSLSDPNLEPHRKFLALRARGLISRSAAPNFEVSNAAEHLRSAALIASQAKPEMRAAELQEIVAQIVASLEKSAAVLRNNGSDGAPKIGMTQKQTLDELLDRARGLGNPAQEPANWTAALRLFAAELSRREVVLRNDYANASAEAINDLDSASQTVYQRFSETPRWARVESILLDPLTGLLRTFASRHAVEIRLLSGGKEPVSLWHSENPAKEPISLPESFEAAPTNAATDLASALRSFVVEKHGNQRTAVVLFSDGQHNDGPSPLDAARTLGNAGIPLYAVGLGVASDLLNAVTNRTFAVQLNQQSKPSKELVDNLCNEPLLREMASLSGGMYLREEQAGRLVRLLETVSEGRIVESETILWQSWWWFGTVIFLFALEWALRKRSGLL